MKEGQFVKEMITLDTLQKEKGLRKRASFIAESKDLFFVFPPTFDLITSQQALPPSYTLGLEFERAPQTFSLLTAADNPQQYKIRLYDFHLEVRRFMPSQRAIQAIPSPRTGTHYLPFTRQTVRFRAIHGGVTQFTIPQISDGAAVLPYHIMVFCLTNDQTTNISKNPFVFWPHFVSNYNLLLNSSSLPAERIGISPNWYDNTRAYSHFLENNALGGSNSTNGITPYSFRYRDFCMCFDLNPGEILVKNKQMLHSLIFSSIDLCAGQHRHRPSSGTLDLQLTFEKPLPEALTLMVLCSYESCIKLSGGLVELNYTL